jgi:hypothetical protein
MFAIEQSNQIATFINLVAFLSQPVRRHRRSEFAVMLFYHCS